MYHSYLSVILAEKKEPLELRARGEGGSRPETSAGPLCFPDSRRLKVPQVGKTRQVRASWRLGVGQVGFSRKNLPGTT